MVAHTFLSVLSTGDEPKKSAALTALTGLTGSTGLAGEDFGSGFDLVGLLVTSLLELIKNIRENKTLDLSGFSMATSIFL